jgi:hypothetical protein
MDLSHISLHQELGNGLREQLDLELARLRQSEPCLKSRLAVARGPIAHAAAQHSPLLFVGLVLLILALTAPFMFRHFGAARSSRALVFMVPVLLVVGLVSHVVVKSAQAMGKFRVAADLCSSPEFPTDSVRGRIQYLGGVEKALDDIMKDARETRDRGISAALE